MKNITFTYYLETDGESMGITPAELEYEIEDIPVEVQQQSTYRVACEHDGDCVAEEVFPMSTMNLKTILSRVDDFVRKQST